MIAELRCLNCARHLADVSLDEQGKVRLDHPSGQASRPILLALRKDGPHCGRCGGRALLERTLDQFGGRKGLSRAA